MSSCSTILLLAAQQFAVGPRHTASLPPLDTTKSLGDCHKVSDTEVSLDGFGGGARDYQHEDRVAEGVGSWPMRRPLIQGET